VALGVGGRWRPVIGLGSSRWTAAAAPRVLARRLATARTVLRFERRTTEYRLLTHATRETVRATSAAPAEVTPIRVYPTSRWTVVHPTRVIRSAALRTVTTRHSTVDRRRATRLHTERVVRERVAGLRIMDRSTTTHRTTTAVAPERQRSSLVVAVPPRLPKTAPSQRAQTAPTASTEPVAVHMGQPRRDNPTVPGPNLDELVDRVLRRIERRALAQRERLGRS
jgi:hypothetical protein